MITVERLAGYDKEQAGRIAELMMQLSRSGEGRGEISGEWVRDVVSSPWHDVLLAVDDGKVVGVAVMSVVMEVMRNVAYLEDFVVDAQARGGGIGGKLWEEILRWGREKGAVRLEFSCGRGRDAAKAFYLKKGAEVYDTEYYRLEL